MTSVDTTNPTNPELMHGRHVLALMGPARKDRAKFMVGLLDEMKSRWNCHISVLCDHIDQKSFVDLAAPGGSVVPKLPLLKEQAWERDPSEVQAVEQLLRSAERTTGVPTGRLILAASHSIGRAYSLPVRETRLYALVRRIMGDNGEPYRLARRFFKFADQVLDQTQTDLIYAFEWGTALNFAFWLAARQRGIPCVAVRFSKIHSGRAFWTTGRMMLNDRARERAFELSDRHPSQEASDFIREFRDRPRVVGYIASRWQNRARRDFLRWHVQNARTIVREFINGFRGQDTSLREPPLGRFYRYYHGLYLSGVAERYFTSFDDEELADIKYVYFPLHKEAELAQCYQATMWHDQRQTVRALASALPSGYRLLVREHRMNVGHRPLRSYREYIGIPNLVLIDPFDSQFKYVHNADLVVTENGSTGWEGLLAMRPTLLLSDTFYDGTRLGRRVRNPDELCTAMLELLTAPAVEEPAVHDAAIGRMIDAELATTFPIAREGISEAMQQFREILEPEFSPGGAASEAAE